MTNHFFIFHVYLLFCYSIIIFFQDNRLDLFCCVHASSKIKPENVDGLLYTLFKSSYVPALMRDKTRALVIIFFFGWLCLSISVIPCIEIGLDQELSMAEDSFVLKYFQVNLLKLFSFIITDILGRYGINYVTNFTILC